MENIAASSWTMILMTVVFAPVLEELLFRGIILKGMLNMKMNPTKAIVVSALIFGLIHGNPWQTTGAFFLGLVLGWVYQKTQSLIIPILLHAFNNGIASLMMIYGNVESFGDFFSVSEWVIFVVGLIILLLFAFLFVKNKFQPSSSAN
jgi:membrane protease YdiL (CAAX protease family)